MIIITCENHAEITNKLIYCQDNNYISSVEYIHNEYDDVILKELNKYKINHYFNLKGELHNPIGPAVKKYNDTSLKIYESYYIKDRLHRLDGPAVIGYNNDGTISKELYWINDIRYSKEEFHQKLKKYKNDHNNM